IIRIRRYTELPASVAAAVILGEVAFEKADQCVQAIVRALLGVRKHADEIKFLCRPLPNDARISELRRTILIWAVVRKRRNYMVATRIEFTLNQQPSAAEIDDSTTLLEVLRDQCVILSPKDGCSPTGQCGCCTVLIDDRAVVACAVPAKSAAGKRI